MNKFAIMIAYAATTLFIAASARADYAGQTINGGLSLGPNGSYLDQVFTPTSIVDPGTFAFADQYNSDSAVFSGTTLTISDAVVPSASGWEMTFSDPSMPFTNLSLVSDNFSPDITYGLSANTIVVDWTGTSASNVTYTAVFDIAPIPEPAPMPLLFVGLTGLALLRRKTLT